MTRAYKRKFDYDEARKLRADGWTYRALAERFGVSATGVARACDPRIAERLYRNTVEYQRAICEDCGGPCRLNHYSPQARLDRAVCRDCSDRRRSEEALLARMNADGDLLCRRCGGHRPMEEFGMRLRNGSPKSYCRACATEMRRDHRHLNAESTRTQAREYKRRWRDSRRVGTQSQEAAK